MSSFKASPVSRMLSQKVRRNLGNLGIKLILTQFSVMSCYYLTYYGNGFQRFFFIIVTMFVSILKISRLIVPCFGATFLLLFVVCFY